MKLWQFLRQDRTAVLLVLLFTFLQSMSSLYLPTLMSQIVDGGVIKGDVGYILGVGGMMLLVTMLGGAASVASSWYGGKATAGFGQRLRSRLFTHVENFTLHEFDRVGTSSLIVRTTNDVMQVQQLINMMLRLMVAAPMSAIGGIVLAIYTDARLAPILVVTIPVLGFAIYMVMGRSIGLFRSIQVKVDRLNRVLRENLTGTRVIRAFDRGAHERERFRDANGELTRTSIVVFQLMAVMMPAVMLVMNLSTVLVLWFGGLEVNQGTLQIGQLMAFIQYVMQVMFSVMMLSMMSFMIPRGQASALRINEVLEMRPEIEDPTEPEGPAAAQGTVEFRRVTFRYPGAEQPAVSESSFTARAGEVTAIIGGTGAGKSTLLKLMPRFYDIEAGSIRIDGVDIRSVTQKDLRACIGYVPQQAVLFTGTIAENIRFGDLEASDERVAWAARVAQATEFIEALPRGMETVIAQGGANLSGGQKQRLAIARALVRPAPIYLFDDSFSALDFRTDARLRSALAREMRNATVIIVAQRVSTVMDADTIVVLDEGRVAGVGRHRELLESSEVYREIVSSQLSPEEIA